MTASVFVTGATGFIGSSVVRVLRARGDEVIALVRDPAKATDLSALGVHLEKGDLASQGDIETAMTGVDSVIHIAGSYRVGITPAERPGMYEANVGATERVLDAAIAAGIGRIVYISTVNAFGNTNGQTVDEKFRRDLKQGFVSFYDETKYLAHVAAERRIEAGAPIVIVMPGTTYGRGDHSGVGEQLKAAYEGKAPFVALGDVGITPVHVDDLAGGIVAALDRGRVGQAYVMCGPPMRLRDAMAIAARAAGRRPPRVTIPTPLVRLGARLAPGSGALIGQPPNLAEILKAADGVTYWASAERAKAELGFRPRDLATGVRDAFGQG